MKDKGLYIELGLAITALIGLISGAIYIKQAKNGKGGENPTVTITQQVSNQQTDQTVSVEPTGNDVQAEVSPAVSIEPSPTESIAPTPTEEIVPTEEPTPTDEPEPTPTEVVEVTETPTPVPTMEPKPTTDITGKPTNTPTPTKAVTPTPTKAATPSPTPSPTPEPTPELPRTMWVNRESIEVFLVDENYTTIGTLLRGDKVVVTKVNALNRKANYISEIQYKGGVGYVQYDLLSANYVEPKWSEPREMKDAARMLMAKVNAYRESQGLRKFEDPYVYYDTTNPGLGDRQYAKALKWAKSSCLAQTADHEGGQIGAGWYTSGGPELSKHSAEEIANQLFQSWKNSPGHNSNMLTHRDGDIAVAKMVVVEYFDGTNYRYCAVMSFNRVPDCNLPEGLE